MAERIMKKVNGLDLSYELKKFASLCYQTDNPLPMFSELIDGHWHDRIEQGDPSLPIHDPTIKTNACEEICWVSLYEATYGKLSDLWFTQRDGKLNSEARDEYLSSGKVFASYNCAGRSNIV